MAAEPFRGARVFDNSVRLFVIFVGITLALVCVRFAAQAFKRREYERAVSTVSYGALVLAPALTGIVRFGQPINWWSTITYLVGLACGIGALSYRVVLSPPWRRFRERWVTKQEAQQTAERAREDEARKWARGREDDALRDDRFREDDVTTSHRTREDGQA